MTNATANAADRFAGIITDRSELNELETDAKSVVNFVVSKTEEVIAGIKERIDARIVMFGALAEEADDALDEGKIVMFTNVQRSPRVYTTKKGTKVESVDLVARSYTILNKTQYEKGKDQIEALSFKAKDLVFTEEDRKATLKQTSGPVA